MYQLIPRHGGEMLNGGSFRRVARPRDGEQADQRGSVKGIARAVCGVWQDNVEKIMRRTFIAGGLGLAAAAGLATAANAQMAQPDDSFQTQRIEQAPRDVTNQDIVDKAELDAVRDRRAAKKQKKGNGAVPATQADIVAGTPIRDIKGLAIGKVDRLDADGVVVLTESGRVKVPLDAFGKDSKGLVFAITKAEFDQMLAGTAG